MDILHKAHAGDIVARYNSKHGFVNWYQFTGEGYSSLTGVEHIRMDGGASLGNAMLNDLRSSGHERLVSGIIRPQSDGSLHSFSTSPNLYAGSQICASPSCSYDYTFSIHTVNEAEAIASQLAQALTVGAAMDMAVQGASLMIFKRPINPLALFVTATVAEYTYMTTTDNLGMVVDDQNISILAMYGYENPQTVGSWWFRPPQPGRFE